MLYQSMADKREGLNSLFTEGLIVLVDDDPLIRATWDLKAKSENVTIETFESREAFEVCIDRYSKQTPIFVDYNLNEEALGLELLDELNKKNFKRLFITTGYEKEDIESPSYVEEVIGKEPPW